MKAFKKLHKQITRLISSASIPNRLSLTVLRWRSISASISILAFALTLTLLHSCEKTERNNPWDDGAHPASWAPHDIEYTTDPPNSLTITWRWDYDVVKPEGFKIDRQVDNQSWENEIQVFSYNQKTFTDNNLNLDDYSYRYRIYAYAGENVSAKIETDKLNILRSLNIGDSYGGGIIAYFFQPGDPGYLDGEVHGLVAAPGNQGSVQWGCQGTTIGGTSTALGTGMANTLAIVDGCSTSGIAARICNDLVLNGYSDWYLPSKDELNKLYINRAAIGGFADHGYWSSSESSSGFAWAKGFNTGSEYGTNKYYFARVRAVRAF